MISISLDASVLLEKINAMEGELKGGEERLRTLMGMIGIVAQRNLKEDCPVASGDLRNSIQFTVEDYKTVVVYAFKYWRSVEYGTPPHRVPFKSLVRWAKLKGINNPEEAAAAIAQAIFKFGTKAHPFVRPATAAIKAESEEALTAFMRDIANISS